MGVSITMAGTDITPFCREDSIDIESILGQGPGVPAASAARTTTFKVRSSLGPAAAAIGAGLSGAAMTTSDYPARDLSGFNHPGLLLGSITLGGTPIVGTDPSTSLGALSVPAAALPNIDASHTWTLEFWFDGTWTAGGFLAQLGGMGQVDSCYLVTTGTTIELDRQNLGYQIGGPAVPANNTPTHIVVTNGGGFLFYINGVQHAGVISGNVGGMDASTLGAWIGIKGDGTAACPGTYSHVAFYQGQLSATRVAAHYAARANTATYEAAVLADAPVAYYPLDDYTAVYTNMFSLAQSDAEVNTGVYYKGGTISLAIDTAQHWQGSHSLKVTTSGGTHTFEQVDCLLPLSSFVNGATYTFSVYVYSVAGGEKLRIYCQADEGFSSNQAIGSSPTYTLAAGWHRYSVTVTMPWSWGTIAHNVGIRLDTGSPAQAITYWLDGFQCVLGSSAQTWIFGGTQAAPTLVRQGELIVYDANSNKIFGGYVSDLEDVTTPHDGQTFTVITALDYWQALDRIGVNLVEVNITDTALIQYLMSTYAPSVDTSLVNFAAPAFTFPRLFMRGKTLAKALQYIADCTGYDIWIDANKRLHYVSPSALGTAPIALSDSPDMVTTFPHKLMKGPHQDDTAIINRVTFYGGKRPSSDYTQDISTQANGNNTTFTLAYYPRESSSGKIVVTVNGVSQVVGYASGAGAKNLLWSQGGVCDVLVNPDSQTLTFNTAPASGAHVFATYRYQTPLVLTVTDSASYSYFGAYYDGYISDTSVVDVQTAMLRCKTLLAEQNYGLLTMTVRCWQPGVTAGMQLSVTNVKRNLSGNYVVQQVRVVPLGAGQFAYDIDLGAWNWHVADILVKGALAAAVTDTTYSEAVDVIQVSTAAFTCHIAFTSATASRTTGAYYARSAPVGDGHDAYPGAFTIAS